ncbi:MAG: ATP-binding protein [Gemmatimonadota bacterium]
MVAILIIAVVASVLVSQHRLATTTREFAVRTLSAQEEERAWVARELHDDVIQQVAVLTHRIEELRADAQESGQVERRATAIGEGLRDLAGTVRHVAHHMHPSSLDHLGLPAALRGLAQELARSEGLDIEVIADESLGDIPPNIAIGLYRVAQEALRNVRKHATTMKATVRIAPMMGGIALEVADEGRGFATGGTASSSGLGLTAMRERVQLLGGRFSLTSEPGKGAKVAVWMPGLTENE